MSDLKPNITFEDYLKLDVRLGTITAVERLKAKKFLKLTVDFGPEVGTRFVITNLGGILNSAQELKDVTATFVLNFEPRMVAGEESQAMILAASGEKGTSILVPCNYIPEIVHQNTPGDIVI